MGKRIPGSVYSTPEGIHQGDCWSFMLLRITLLQYRLQPANNQQNLPQIAQSCQIAMFAAFEG
jgi:hypothetical protein